MTGYPGRLPPMKINTKLKKKEECNDNVKLNYENGGDSSIKDLRLIFMVTSPCESNASSHL